MLKFVLIALVPFVSAQEDSVVCFQNEEPVDCQVEISQEPLPDVELPLVGKKFNNDWYISFGTQWDNGKSYNEKGHEVAQTQGKHPDNQLENNKKGNFHIQVGGNFDNFKISEITPYSEDQALRGKKQAQHVGEASHHHGGQNPGAPDETLQQLLTLPSMTFPAPTPSEGGSPAQYVGLNVYPLPAAPPQVYPSPPQVYPSPPYPLFGYGGPTPGLYPPHHEKPAKKGLCFRNKLNPTTQKTHKYLSWGYPKQAQVTNTISEGHPHGEGEHFGSEVSTARQPFYNYSVVKDKTTQYTFGKTKVDQLASFNYTVVKSKFPGETASPPLLPEISECLPDEPTVDFQYQIPEFFSPYPGMGYSQPQTYMTSQTQSPSSMHPSSPSLRGTFSAYPEANSLPSSSSFGQMSQPPYLYNLKTESMPSYNFSAYDTETLKQLLLSQPLIPHPLVFQRG